MIQNDSKVVPLRPGLGTPGGQASLEKIKDAANDYLARRLRVVLGLLDETFFDLACSAKSGEQRAQYFDAMRAIRVERHGFEIRFLQQLRQRFVAIGVSASPAKENSLLMEEGHLEEMIALDTMVSKSLSDAGPLLEECNARLASALARPVTAQSNPYGPESLCDLFAEMVRSLKVDIPTRLLLYKLFERQVLEKLGDLYSQVNSQLESLGVKPAEKLGELDGELSQQSESWPTDVQVGPIEATVSRGSKGRRGRLIERLNRLLGQSSSAHDTLELPETSLAELVGCIQEIQREMLQSPPVKQRRMNLLEVVERKLSNRLAQSPATLRDKDRQVVHLVDAVIDKFDDSAAIPDALCQLIQRLKLPVLQVALLDHGFFDRPKHPARRILNEIAQLSIRFDFEQYDGRLVKKDPLYRQVDRLVNKLFAIDNLRADQLADVFADFLTQIDGHDRHTAVLEQRALDKVGAADKINWAHTRVTRELALMLEGRVLPCIVLELAEQGWAKVLFLDCLKAGVAPGQWQFDIALMERLIAMVDGGTPQYAEFQQLAARIEQRLADVGFDEAQLDVLMARFSQCFFTEAAMALPGGGRQVSEPEQSVRVEEFCASLPGELISLSDEELPEGEAPGQINQLKLGAWFKLIDADESEWRCKLAGVMPVSGKYVFVDRQGRNLCELTPADAVSRLQKSALQPLDNRDLFGRALDAVIREIQAADHCG